MGIGAGTAALIATVVGVGSSVASGFAQKSAEEEARDEADRLAEQARIDEREFLANQAKEQEELAKSTVQFGVEDNEPIGSFNDFLAPVQQTTGLTTGKAKPSGLGFA